MKVRHEACCHRKKVIEEQQQNAASEGNISVKQIGGASSGAVSENTEADDCQSALNGNLKTIPMKPCVNEKYDLSLFLHGKRANVLKNLERELKEKKGVKWFITVQVKMVKYRPDEQDEFSSPHFRSNCQRLVNLNEVSNQYQESVDKVKESFQTYQREGSGWQLQEVSKHFENYKEYVKGKINYC